MCLRRNLLSIKENVYKNKRKPIRADWHRIEKNAERCPLMLKLIHGLWEWCLPYHLSDSFAWDTKEASATWTYQDSQDTFGFIFALGKDIRCHKTLVGLIILHPQGTLGKIDRAMCCLLWWYLTFCDCLLSHFIFVQLMERERHSLRRWIKSMIGSSRNISAN